MKTLKKIIFSIVVLNYSCQSDLVDAFTYKFSPPKISIFCELSANEYPTVLVTRTLLNTDTIFKRETFAIKDALVILSYETNKDTLEYNKTTNLFSSKHKVKAGQNYTIEVSQATYGRAYAKDIYIPQPFNIKSKSLIKKGINTSQICGNNDYQDLQGMIDITFGEYKEDSTYFNFLEFSNKNICYIKDLKFDVFKCEIERISKYFNRSCLGHENKFLFSAIGPIGEKKFIDIILSIYSKDYYKWALSREERLGVEIGLLENVSPYTNIINGYGLAYGVNKNRFILEN